MIAVIDYGIGNLASIVNTFARLGEKVIVSDDKRVLKKADALILPGVGAAGEGMKNLEKRSLDKLIVEQIKQGIPFLGICLGMQLLFEKSAEGNVFCLGVLRGTVKKFQKKRKIPQIGWNQVKYQKTEYLFKGIPDGSNFYFVNSYYCLPEDKLIITAETDYGEKFASAIVKNNISATQFHPEKSGAAGQKLLSNWLKTFK